jgi:hypothetical protein
VADKQSIESTKQRGKAEILQRNDISAEVKI